MTRGQRRDVINVEDYDMRKRQEGMHVHEGCAVAKGMKQFMCIKCDRVEYNYANGVEICKECRYELDICDICGKEFS